MIKPTLENFNLLVERAVKTSMDKNKRPVIKKELLHYDLLFILDRHHLLDKLTFQGGTALRLCYGASRLSEDLDFVGGKDFVTSNVEEMRSCIEMYIAERYGLQVTVKPPSKTTKGKENINVDHWQISITTDPEKKDIPKQRIKIQICNVPAYTREPQALKINYDFLPDGYADTLIMTESLEEIMADKLVALVDSFHKKIRNRDIWDLRWLRQQGTAINPKFIFSKINDYQIINYMGKLEEVIKHIDEVVKGKKFHDEMSRFLLNDIIERTLEKDKFKDYLSAETKNLLTELKKIFDAKEQVEAFQL